MEKNEKNSLLFPRSPGQIPAVTSEQMIEVDRAMMEDYGISLLQMMENAGRQLSEAARRLFLNGNCAGKKILVLAGRGGNGGGALVAARHLSNAGAKVFVRLSAPLSRFVGAPAHQAGILEKMGVPISEEIPSEKSESWDVILDGLIGYSLLGNVRGRAAELIQLANEAQAPRLSLDVPSGLNATTGEASTATIRASATLTLALPKTGLFQFRARNFAGALFLADIGVPPQLYSRAPLNLQVPILFSAGPILRIS